MLLGVVGVDSSAQTLGQWHFDESSGDIATDSAGDNDGTLVGDATFVPGGIVGNAVGVTKSGNGLVEMGEVFPMTSGDFSVSAWIKTGQNDQQAELIPVAKHQSGSRNGYFLAVNTTSTYGQIGKALFYASVLPGSEVISTTTVNDGEWHLIVGTYRASGWAEIFVDGRGVEDSGSVPAIVGNDASFLAGGIEFGGMPTGLYDGQIDEMLIFGHALHDEEVQLLFEHPQITLLFASGFESGDTSAWSTAVE
jgi:hypothetical protein